MANTIMNKVTMPLSTLKEIEKKYLDDGQLSFQKIIPMPESLQLTSGGITHAAIYYALKKKSDSDQRFIIKSLKAIDDFLYGNLWNQIKHYHNESDLPRLEEKNAEFIPNDELKKLNINNLEELGDAYIDNIKNYGHPTWYDWRYDKWGTKWDVGDYESHQNTMVFDTANGCPIPIFEKLSKEFPDDVIKLEYEDLDDSSHAGEIVFKGGEIVEAYTYEIEEEINI